MRPQPKLSSGEENTSKRNLQNDQKSGEDMMERFCWKKCSRSPVLASAFLFNLRMHALFCHLWIRHFHFSGSPTGYSFVFGAFLMSVNWKTVAPVRELINY